ncbi:MAG TPA: bi-domain-containing oxidoreductase [Dongiaceae bacterium]|nr:bi-domain-containing oxidoreductase [Dongiaceae bacterium]
MKQVLQDLRTGATSVENVPCPMVQPGQVLIRTVQTLVSAGTEKMLVDFGKASLIEKARQQPDKVRMVLDKIRTDGLVPTLEAVRAKLDQPIPMGYCNVGVIVQCGDGVAGLLPGDRVISNGHHAEMVTVPKHLCARIPDAVNDDQASFTVMAAIALQGIRLVQPELGETVAVIGLGLVGLLTVQLLKASGCRVIGFDFDAERVSLARQFGAESVILREGVDPVAAALAFTRNVGVDAVLITASTRSNDPVHQAANMCRKRGRIVLVGVVGLELSRADFYEKELSFQVSCSYGPGRYDPDYEQRGRDYPIGYVRWTEQRNFEAVLTAMAAGSLRCDTMISARFRLDQAQDAYAAIAQGGTLGVVLECDRRQALDQLLESSIRSQANGDLIPPLGPLQVGFIGAGNYASRVLIPAFRKTDVQLARIACSGGTSGVIAARKFGFDAVTTDSNALLQDPTVNLVVVATRHDSHARYASEALLAGKHVFVEKPLAIEHSDLINMEHAYASTRKQANCPQLMIGFNRRFSPLIIPLKQAIDPEQEPVCINITVNAGQIPASSWIQDRKTGGGRIIGELCHFIDLALHLAGSSITAYDIRAIGNQRFNGITSDKCVVQLKFANGSVASLQYFANGHAAFPKERIELFWAGHVFQVDNFRKLRSYGGLVQPRSLWRQDKGNAACVASFVDCLRNGRTAPIPFDDMLQVSRCAIELTAMLEG